jgi:hypothetical protein
VKINGAASGGSKKNQEKLLSGLLVGCITSCADNTLEIYRQMRETNTTTAKNISPVLVCATCSTHLILFDLINPKTLGKMYNL